MKVGSGAQTAAARAGEGQVQMVRIGRHKANAMTLGKVEVWRKQRGMQIACAQLPHKPLSAAAVGLRQQQTRGGSSPPHASRCPPSARCCCNVCAAACRLCVAAPAQRVARWATGPGLGHRRQGPAGSRRSLPSQRREAAAQSRRARRRAAPRGCFSSSSSSSSSSPSSSSSSSSSISSAGGTRGGQQA